MRLKLVLGGALVAWLLLNVGFPRPRRAGGLLESTPFGSGKDLAGAANRDALARALHLVDRMGTPALAASRLAALATTCAEHGLAEKARELLAESARILAAAPADGARRNAFANLCANFRNVHARDPSAAFPGAARAAVDQPALRLVLATTLAETGLLDEAVAAARESGSSRAMAKVAEALLAAGRTEEANGLAGEGKAILGKEIHTHRGMELLALPQALVKLGRGGEAVELARRIGPAALGAIVARCAREGDFARALILSRELAPRDRFIVAGHLLRAGRVDEAKRISVHADRHPFLVDHLLARGEVEQALEAARRVDAPPARVEALIKAGALEEAEEAAAKSTGYAGTRDRLLVRAAVAWAKAGKVAEARRCAARIEEARQRVRALRDMAAFGDTLALARELAHDETRGPRTDALLHVAAGLDGETALEVLRLARDHTPASTDDLARLARAFLDEGAEADAMALLERAAERLRPEDDLSSAVYYRIAAAYLEAGRAADALRAVGNIRSLPTRIHGLALVGCTVRRPLNLAELELLREIG